MLFNDALQWRHNGQEGVSNHQPHHCLLTRLFGSRSKKTSKLRVTGLCAGNSPVTGEFPAQMASYAENVSIWWRHHGQSYHSWIDVILRANFQQQYGIHNDNFSISVLVASKEYTGVHLLCRVTLCLRILWMNGDINIHLVKRLIWKQHLINSGSRLLYNSYRASPLVLLILTDSSIIV